ncbi:MAG: arginine repressor [Acutalibacteraceae bacterium]
MKSSRQEKILELIKNKIFLTQEDLQNELLALGYNVTQSTVSRDIKELRIVKGHDADGNYRYIANEPAAAVMQNREHYRELYSRAVKTVSFSLNNVVIKCYTGMAQGACVAVDEMFGDMMLGSLAGDDTIIIVTAGETQSARLTAELNKLLK